MDLNYTDEELAFRDEVRAFFDEKLSHELSEKVRLNKGLTKDDMEGWHATLHEKGWLVPNWCRCQQYPTRTPIIMCAIPNVWPTS